MIRKAIFPKEEEKRNYDIQRIEAFSDGVFAFAVTLLIVSLEVPKSFDELMVTMRGFFALVQVFWYWFLSGGNNIHFSEIMVWVIT